jgi:hypothetical protein
VSAPGDYDDGEIGGMIVRGNRSTQRKPAPVPLCPPQTPHAARMRTRAAAVGSQRQTAELRHGLRRHVCAAFKISESSVEATLKEFQTCRSPGKELPPTHMIKISKYLKGKV